MANSSTHTHQTPTEQRFFAAVNVIRGLPKNGEYGDGVDLTYISVDKTFPNHIYDSPDSLLVGIPNRLMSLANVLAYIHAYM